ncbi:MAG: H(+)/Cl(-) exchange transporter ClcA [Tatlockia sp.]|nr:H(+)/Cl(-) exchange transporter ClcA [Tatlockia sp.]
MRNKILINYSIAILLGLTTGIISSLFQLAIQHLDAFIAAALAFISNKTALIGLFSAMITMMLVFIAWFMVRDIAPEAAGSGVQEIEGALAHKRPINWRRLLPVKFFGGVMAISSKLVLGREGPTIQMGGNLGEMYGELFRFSQEKKDTLIMAGAAAGLASAFNAPLAGVLFVMEELRDEFQFTFINLKIIAISCVMATVTLHYIVGSGPAIPMDTFDLPSLKSLWLFFLLGIIFGFAGLLFNKTLMRTLELTDKLSKWQRVLYILSVGCFIGFLAYYYPDLVGGGYHIIQRAVSLSPDFSFLILILVLRFFTTMLSYSTGVPGGIFAPMLALGAVLGTAAFYILNYLISDLTIHPGMFAVAGMGALFSAAVRAPITGIVLVVEMTQNYSLILPLMVCCLTSTTIMQLAADQPIYTQLLRRTLRKARKLEDK